MQEIALQTGCKANLYLKIAGRDASGYHTLQSLFIPLSSPSDTLQIFLDPCGSQGLEIESNFPELEKSNILYKVYALVRKKFSYAPGLKVKLIKRVPMGAGLGGGSADGASLFGFLLGQLPDRVRPSQEEMLMYARQLGSDVPFFLLRRPAWVEGTGEKITLIDCNLQDRALVVICPQLSVSTKWAYQAWDDLQSSPAGKTGTPLRNILTGDEIKFRKFFPLNGHFLYNDFERVVFSRFPELYELKLWCLSHGARGAVMSGSGASMLALCSRSKIDKFRQDLDRQGLVSFVNFF